MYMTDKKGAYEGERCYSVALEEREVEEGREAEKEV